jgi:hypothetical protein
VSKTGGPLPDEEDVAVSGLGLTWSLVDDGTTEGAAGYRVRRRVYVFQTSGTASSGAVTITYSGAATLAEITWSLQEWAGADVAGTPITNVSTNSVGTGSTQLTASVTGTSGAGDAIYVAFGVEESGGPPTLESGWVAFSADETDEARHTIVAWDDHSGDTTPTVTWSSTSNGAGAVAFRINAAPLGVTVAAIAKVAANSSYLPVLAFDGSSNDTRRAVARYSGNNMGMDSSGIEYSAGVNWQVADDWCLVAWTKPGATGTLRGHKYVFDTDTWTHTDGDSADDDSVTLTDVEIGRWYGDSSTFSGRMALIGAWKSELSDGTLEGLTDNLQQWIDASPDALWRLDQSTVNDDVVDETGNGADQTARSGTSVVTDDDPDFVFGEVTTGTADASLTLTATGTGHVTRYGQADAQLTLTATATGSRRVYGTAAADLTLTATATSASLVSGTAQADLALTAVAAGTVRVHGTATADLSLTATARSGITVPGTGAAILQLSATAVGQVSREPRFLLRNPTYDENLWTDDRLFIRYRLPRGISLAVLGSVVEELTYPYQDDLDDYDVVYMGGRDHLITAHEANILIAAGYGDNITPLPEE